MNLVTDTARSREDEIVAHIDDARARTTCARSCERFREGRAEGSWENFLYFGARLFYDAKPEDGEEWKRAHGRASARSASRTSPAARRCACPRR